MAIGSFLDSPVEPATAPIASDSGVSSAAANALIVGFCQKSTGDTG